MSQDNVFEFKNPGVSNAVRDALTECCAKVRVNYLRKQSRRRSPSFWVNIAANKSKTGRTRMVRNGYLPARTIQTGIGEVPVKAPRVRDRAGEIRFSSSILPAYLRRTKTIEALLPWLYLKGISTGGFSEALAALFGRDAPGLGAGLGPSAGTMSRLKTVWHAEHTRWEARSLASKRYVYLWVDGIHFVA